MDTINLYTESNWHLIRHTFPNGNWHNNCYMVIVDIESDSYWDKLAKLSAVSSYLGSIVGIYAVDGYLAFKLCYKG